jgi:hypothetical protein
VIIITTTTTTVNLVSGWTIGQSSFDSRQDQGTFLVASVQTARVIDPAYCSAESGGFSPAVEQRSVKLATHIPLVSRLRISAALRPFPHLPSWHVIVIIIVVVIGGGGVKV